MVAAVAEKLSTVPFVSVHDARPPALRRPRIAFVGCDDVRGRPRRDIGLHCWLMDEAGAARGQVLDLSESGARITQLTRPQREGDRLLCKVVLDPAEPPLVVRCKVVRATDEEVAVRFLELNFDDWFRLGRFVDRLG